MKHSDPFDCQADAQQPLPNQPAATIEDLTQPVQFLKGVGPQRAQLLQKLGLRTVVDVIFFFPRSYQNFSQLSQVKDLREDQPACVIGEVVDIQQWNASTGTQVLAVLLPTTGRFLAWYLVQPALPDQTIRGGPTSDAAGSPEVR